MIRLNHLNFEKLIHIGTSDIDKYNYDTYKENGFEHKPICGYCTSCEENNCNLAKDDESYRLTNISHGTHSDDFFKSLNNSPDTKSWHKNAIMFIYETPSLDYGIYKDVKFNGFNKRPSKDWYWIHGNHKNLSFPFFFKGGAYGEFVLSAIQTFKLSNVYMTNLVKCGLNNENGKFKGLASFNESTIKNCYVNFLEKEISIIKPEIIFTVGSAVEKWTKYLVGNSYHIQQLPHPAGQRRGFRDEHYKAIYFWSITKTLYKAGIIDSNEGAELAKLYLGKYDNYNP